MPIFTYECPKCGKQFDKIVSHFDTEKKERCPDCESPSQFTIPAGSRSTVRFQFNYFGPDV